MHDWLDMGWPALILTVAAAALTGCELAATLFTIARNAVPGKRWRQRAAADGHLPACSVIIPTKGLPVGAEENFRAYLDQDYPDYRVVFAVENNDDPGVPLLERLCGEYTRARLVVAGLTTRGSQQNHNMLAGAAASGDAEVLVFADNDIRPDKLWLRRMVTPLGDRSITVTSAYRWLVAARGTFGEHVHVFMNAVMYVHFTLVSVLAGRTLWGGSFAMSRADFEELEVPRLWRDTISDDMTLSTALARTGRRALLIPGLLIPTGDVMGRAGDAVSWYARQLVNVKAYQRPVWLWALLPLHAAGAFFSLLLPLSIAAALVTGLPFFSMGGLAALVFLAGETLMCGLTVFIGPVRRPFKAMATVTGLRWAQIAGAFRSIGIRSMTWADVVYRFDRDGRVTAIERGT